jgi:hypothetical protein
LDQKGLYRGLVEVMCVIFDTVWGRVHRQRPPHAPTNPPPIPTNTVASHYTEPTCHTSTRPTHCTHVLGYGIRTAILWYMTIKRLPITDLPDNTLHLMIMGGNRAAECQAELDRRAHYAPYGRRDTDASEFCKCGSHYSEEHWAGCDVWNPSPSELIHMDPT